MIGPPHVILPSGFQSYMGEGYPRIMVKEKILTYYLIKSVIIVTWMVRLQVPPINDSRIVDENIA